MGMESQWGMGHVHRCFELPASVVHFQSSVQSRHTGPVTSSRGTSYLICLPEEPRDDHKEQIHSFVPHTQKNFNSFIEIEFTSHTIYPLTVYNQVVFSIFTEFSTMTSINSRRFSSPQKETPYSLAALSISPQFPSPAIGKNQSTFCLSRFAYSGHLV